LLIELTDYRALDHFNVPHKLQIYPPDLGASPWSFAPKANMALWLKQGSLRPTLVPADFEPPKPKK
jgi:hypothetical protein